MFLFCVELGAKKRSKSKETDSSPLIEVAGSKDAPSIGGSRERPAKRSTFESSGGDFVATRTRRQLSKTVGRSPLSRMEIDNDGLGSLSDNPVDVDQAPLLQGSIGANKRQKLKEKVSLLIDVDSIHYQDFAQLNVVHLLIFKIVVHVFFLFR